MHDPGEPAAVLDVERHIQAKKGLQGADGLLAIGALRSDHLIHDGPGNEANQKEDGHGHAKERGQEWRACGARRSGAYDRPPPAPAASAGAGVSDVLVPERHRSEAE